MFPDLRSFISELRRDRDIVEVAAPVDAHLEAAEIHRRVIAAGGPALLFTNVRGKSFPLVTNLFGTARRAEMAFGATRRWASQAAKPLAQARSREARGRRAASAMPSVTRQDTSTQGARRPAPCQALPRP